MSYVLDPESIRAYRTRVMAFAQDLWEEKDQQVRANLALMLADAATTLARLEVEEARKLTEGSLAQVAKES